MRFHGGGTAWNHIAMDQAIADAGLSADLVSNPRTGIIMGSGGASTQTIVQAAEITRNKGGPKRIGPTSVPKAMGSTASATLATWFKIKGVNYSISSACATSNHCIGNAYETIQAGRQDIIFAGGCEELDWTLSALFDAMGAMSSGFNDRPSEASRAYDKDRDGFVIAGGAGVLVLEEYERAKARGARIYAELAGFGMSGDAFHMTSPSENGEGGGRCMRAAINDAGIDPSQIGYINAHGTSTPAGDVAETMGIKGVLGDHAAKVMVSSTKSMTGHLLGAAGGVEAVFSVMALHAGIIPPTINLEHPGEGCDLDYVPHTAREHQVEYVMSNSFGFGGTNGSLVFRKI